MTSLKLRHRTYWTVCCFLVKKEAIYLDYVICPYNKVLFLSFHRQVWLEKNKTQRTEHLYQTPQREPQRLENLKEFSYPAIAWKGIVEIAMWAFGVPWREHEGLPVCKGSCKCCLQAQHEEVGITNTKKRAIIMGKQPEPVK